MEDLRAEFKIRMFHPQVFLFVAWKLTDYYPTDHDVDLFDNPPDDLHTVSSLLKGWFRSLPAAILPDDVQKRVYEKCKDVTDAVKPPQAFIDELSNLPPYVGIPHVFDSLNSLTHFPRTTTSSTTSSLISPPSATPPTSIRWVSPTLA